MAEEHSRKKQEGRSMRPYHSSSGATSGATIAIVTYRAKSSTEICMVVKYCS